MCATGLIIFSSACTVNAVLVCFLFFSFVVFSFSCLIIFKDVFVANIRIFFLVTPQE